MLPLLLIVIVRDVRALAGWATGAATVYRRYTHLSTLSPQASRPKKVLLIRGEDDLGRWMPHVTLMRRRV